MIQFNCELPVALDHRFTQFCKSKGLKKRRCTAAALELFMAAPIDVRGALIEGDYEAFDVWAKDHAGGAFVRRQPDGAKR